MTDNSSAQLSLAFENDPWFLVRKLEKGAGTAVILVLTDNSTSMLSVRRKGALFYVRLHRIFLGADEDTLDEIASFIRQGRGRMTRFRAFIEKMGHEIRRKPPRNFEAKTHGRYHDLHCIFERLNCEYFEGKLSSVITWGKGSYTSRTVRKRTLGSYSHQLDTIRINPVLDRKAVPRYYVEFVVYHEMLHAAMGVRQEGGGRRRVHTREFRDRERLFRGYERAIRYEKDGRHSEQ